MKKQEFIKMIEALPYDAEIRILEGDELQGYYSFTDPHIEEDEAYEYTSKGGSIEYESTISNWTPPNHKKVIIYRLN